MALYEAAARELLGYVAEDGAAKGGAFRGVQLEDLQSADVKEYLVRRTSKAAANGEIALLSAAYTLAVERGWAPLNPCRGVRRNPRRRRSRYINVTERKRLIAAAPPQIASMIEISYLTACRKSEVLDIRLADICDEGLYVRRGKTQDRMLFEMTDELGAVLERARAASRGRRKRRGSASVASLYLFSGRTGQRYTEDGLQTMWQRVRRRAGLPDVNFHDIRRARITDAEHKFGMTMANALAGHRSVTTTERYLVQTGMRIVKPEL